MQPNFRVRTMSVALLFTGLCLTGTAALAASAEDRPCREDVLNFCEAAMTDRDSMRACMREHFSEFSEQCQASLRERMESGKGGRRGRDSETESS